MPKLTNAPARAAVAARSMAATKASTSPIVWSEGNSSISGSDSVSVSASAAMQAAGAVFRPTGSRSSACGPTALVRDQHGRGEALGLDDPMNGLLQQTFVAEQG